MHTKKIIRRLQNKNKKDEVIFMVGNKFSNMGEWKIRSDIGAANTANATSRLIIKAVFEREPNCFQRIYKQGRTMEHRDVISYGF